MTNVSEELARLAQLRDQGVLTPDEFEAQKAAVLRGDRPAAPEATAADKGKGALGKGCLVLVGIVIVLMIIGALMGEDEKAGTAGGTAAVQPSAAPTEVTAVELFNAYDANEAAAQQQYGDRALLVSGNVTGVDLDFTNEPVVKLRTPNEFMSAQASLTEASQAKASTLSKGADIKLLCAGVSEVAGTPMLKDCEIQ